MTEPIKYPRTLRFAWSSPHKGDRKIESLDGFIGREVVATLKIDGENTTLYRDHIHARSLTGYQGEDRAFVKALHARIRHDIPEGWRICGENYAALHTIRYASAKPPFFAVFSIWNDENECLPWDEMLMWTDILDLPVVPVLYRGLWDETIIRSLWEPEYQGDEMEGYVVRVADGFPYHDFGKVVAKYVRPGFVPANTPHWKSRKIVFNG